MPNETSDQPVLISSALLAQLDVPHAFTTRTGGISPPPYASLNFGSPSHLPDSQRDPAPNIHENRRRVFACLSPSLANARVARVHQVHSADVQVVSFDRSSAPVPPCWRWIDLPGPGGPPELSTASSPPADAIILAVAPGVAAASRTPDAALVAENRVADCAPVLIASPDGRVVAAVHAGWRGCVSGIIPRTLARMTALGVHAPAARAAVGPCIGFERFEVGAEVADEFRRRFPDHPELIRAAPASAIVAPIRSIAPSNKFLIDLKGALRAQLIAAGISSSNVDIIPGCTVSEPDRFFSHRRDAGVTGRMAAFIAPAPGLFGPPAGSGASSRPCAIHRTEGV